MKDLYTVVEGILNIDATVGVFNDQAEIISKYGSIANHNVFVVSQNYAKGVAEYTGVQWTKMSKIKYYQFATELAKSVDSKYFEKEMKDRWNKHCKYMYVMTLTHEQYDKLREKLDDIELRATRDPKMIPQPEEVSKIWIEDTVDQEENVVPIIRASVTLPPAKNSMWTRYVYYVLNDVVSTGSDVVLLLRGLGKMGGKII